MKDMYRMLRRPACPNAWPRSNEVGRSISAVPTTMDNTSSSSHNLHVEHQVVGPLMSEPPIAQESNANLKREFQRMEGKARDVFAQQKSMCIQSFTTDGVVKGMLSHSEQFKKAYDDPKNSEFTDGVKQRARAWINRQKQGCSIPSGGTCACILKSV